MIYSSSLCSYSIQGCNTLVLTPLNLPHPKKCHLTRNLTSPNKATGKLKLFVFSVLLDKNKKEEYYTKICITIVMNPRFLVQQIN